MLSPAHHHCKHSITSFHHQRGASLIVSLVMLLVLLMLGISLANIALMGEKAARNDRDRQIAMQAAEAALTDAEMDIENSSRSVIFSPDSSEGFTDLCGKGDSNIYQGLCTYNGDRKTAAWLTADIANTSGTAASVKYGRFTGKTMPSGAGPFPNKLPRYLIELMMDTAPGQEVKAAYIYRISAVGFGTNSSTQVVVQSFYRKADSVPAAASQN
ncbi:pilus assembly PilX family protein [Solimicrobium silvestre]|uniref:Tfp pilus assembly protein PilX n=1 Tax=Solimicrobium silvestre TaxID=2099400 RepID=A0A2S9H4Y7_9BURK|nr:PilX N-terminal domain-containing pilus assembly protein [Solimicrobium silvestre]PRC95052.1 Tfp pilus assembly protein PilX [Solimicrobium silvestre]